MDYLNDNKLEELGFIKEIDTLKIIEKSEQIKENRYKSLIFILFVIIITTAFISQLLFIYLFNGIKFVKIGILMYIFISIVVALVLVDKGEKSLC